MALVIEEVAGVVHFLAEEMIGFPLTVGGVAATVAAKDGEGF